ncbi:fimbrillin family protein [Bacteroides sp. ET71]|uniref:fimbrillin family protein n=1 Tax=Bacteroides sp. ET71 TaxID=2939421 RepID=UPI002012BEAB|nr:fimbrillin family protein [Bacteroides sp. ET71]MCL1615794.1 fimbrillin family protein [Bacteroides sp. ET71]
MKHHFIKRASIWTSTSILVLFTACVNQIESETDIKEGNIPINFSIKIKETATKVSENAFEAGDEVGVYGILTGNQINDERYIDNLLLKCTTGNNLIPEKPVFYPEGDATLDFIAYHPYQPNAISPNSSTIPISIHSDQSNSSNRSSSDFMTAVTEKVSNSNSSVSLEFHHRLTKLKISLLPGENEDIDEMLAANPRIIASNFYTQANYDFTTEEFSQFDHIADIISAGEWKKTEGKLSGKEFIFIPQDIDNTQSFQMEWNGRIYTCPMPPIDRLESNKQYELEINAEETESLELEGVVATIKDWEDGIPLENVENEYTNQALHLSVLSFEPSNIYRIYMKGREVAEICKEYLTGDLNSTAITAYPIRNGMPDLTQGTVLQLLETTENINGGTINWNLEENTFTYEEGSLPIIRQIYFDETGTLQIKSSTPPASINVVAYTLRDMRDVTEIINYPIVKVGTQYWMRENLRATSYANGTYIEPQEKLDGTAGYFNTGDIYFYNGEALEAGEISPEGWQLPTAKDWQTLSKYVNKDASLLKGGEWRILSSDPNSEIGNPVSNLTMFSILPLGQWSHSGGHVNLNQAAGFWTWDYETNSIAKETIFFSGQSDEMQIASTQASGQNFSKALSVRCLKRE